ncbi:hypothetical protein FA15DRAFT_701025 [Coprinopsis marcescibilis]|uniref:Vps72/YL1 N-terminal domain-containing protein n=1 Tax=Coprinopsis marcescibilis TaxID=230819 RepID=A0A5C3L6D2_COPMA|nr:hypothetical protein FA15DRAFT_701025 [Coprinopsis marcescibilis]
MENNDGMDVDVEPVELLATRRSRRSTAGNRMQVALAEMAAESQLAEEAEAEDKEFEVAKDEQDLFESDFESTDEEAEEENVQAGQAVAEKAANEEDKRERRAAKSKQERAMAVAHERNRATFNPEVEATTSRVAEKEKDKHFARFAVGDEEPGEGRRKRKSQRAHTILNTSETVKRLKASRSVKASAPKKLKFQSKTYTQAELIARALDNEEGNIREHRDYLKTEEEKRKQARVVKQTITGPVLRWVSRIEEVKVPVPPPAPVPVPSPPVLPTSAMVAHPVHPGSVSYLHAQAGTTPPQAWTAVQVPYPHYAPVVFQNWPPQNPSTTPSTGTGNSVALSQAEVAALAPSLPLPSASNVPPPSVAGDPSLRQQDKEPQEEQLASRQQPLRDQATGASVDANHPNTTNNPPVNPNSNAEPEMRSEKVIKNYIVHELGRREGIRKPTWNESMGAMFGKHVKWDEIKVYTGKGRPLGRPVQTCALTGKPVIYKDISGVGFGDVSAYKKLRKLERHEYVWDPVLACYVGKQEVAGDDRDS